MGLFDWLRGKGGLDTAELARRLGLPESDLGLILPAYREFPIPKRSGGTRRIFCPEPTLKDVQRTIDRRLLKRLRPHPSATGFQSGHSIVTHARHHAGRAVVVRMDLIDFFPSTSANRVEKFFRAVGWKKAPARILTRLCTHEGGLPQGAPTSPRLSNLVNYPMDLRLARLADSVGARYSRYADDLTFSFEKDDSRDIHNVISFAKIIVGQHGYTVHGRRKLSVRRRHQQQRVTGLVVNQSVNLPRATRRWLRAVEHHQRTGRNATLDPQQLAGWKSLQSMIARQSQ